MCCFQMLGFMRTGLGGNGLTNSCLVGHSSSHFVVLTRFYYQTSATPELLPSLLNVVKVLYFCMHQKEHLTVKIQMWAEISA